MRLSKLSFRVFFTLSSVSLLVLIANARFNNSVQVNVGVSRGVVLEGFLGVDKLSRGFDARLEPGPVNKSVEAISISCGLRIEPTRGATTITS